MIQPAMPAPLPRTLEYFALKQEIEDFAYAEADLLDQRMFREWLDLLADDLVYFMPLRRNVKYGRHAEHENTAEGKDISWFEEDKWTLSKRVDQIMTGIHWAEEPLSRVCHLVANVQLLEARPSVSAPREVVARSRFLVYQNRMEYETNLFVGKRTDTLRKVEGQWKLARREIILDQNVLLSKSLTVFF
jgi:3-phenylpropionate/cinnamic acid dioxygenase small subunit